ncbi:MAG TPA: GNAT family N-acetyltransferase [Pseudonocardiaceae bacterium]|jgi:RimJ/RimL family protein N-acetyltransferase|nr:GNAT family N-acetyltransferase [Pseudonocardiaceae bacterium]
MDTVLTTERLVLRPFTDADAERLFELDNDSEVMRHLNGGEPITLAEVRATTLPRLTRYHPCVDAPGFWAAQLRTTGEFLGWFAFEPVRPDRSDEISLGYRLRTAAWGHGYATEGCRALVHRGFTELGVRRVTATTMAVNTRSRRVMTKAGLAHVRTFHQEWAHPLPGAELGDVEYALRLEDWQQGTNRQR